MPVTLSYPGVYVSEIPSGVHAITGVPTSIAAFVGRAVKGGVNAATTVTSYAEYERVFGGLAAYSSMGFAVRDFFLNGGATAVIVRLYRNDPADGAKAATVLLPAGGLALEAATPGTWGQSLRVAVDLNVPSGMAASMGVDPATVFNLAVTDTSTGAAEYFNNLTVADHPSRVDRVLKARSNLLAYTAGAAMPAKAAVGFDPVGAAEQALQTQRRTVTADPVADAKAVATAKQAVDAANAKLVGNDGASLGVLDFVPNGGQTAKKGLYALEGADLFNLLVIPPLDDNGVPPQLVDIAADYCESRRAFYIVDAPVTWDSPAKVTAGMAASPDTVGTRSKNAALFWPRAMEANPFKGGILEAMSPAGAVAGVFARTDAERGVWKAPAGLDATLSGVLDLAYRMTDGENGQINPLGVNALRVKNPAGRIVYGARTLQGDDRLAAEYKYVPVRRVALFIEESAYRGLQWAVFEPNDEPLWASIRLNLGAFMHGLFRQGAFQGKTPAEAYFVKCDSETTTQNDIDLGIVNVVLGFAPLKPAEFVVIGLKQIAGQVEV